ncbi:hypothetical protein ACIOJ9_39965 [Streptomyces sp. NPDC088175]|uniref:hypothetical protein n=1 Tax=unclassified Streptomyces TaxID=2593676 RepID=UPI00380130BD
MGLFSKKSTETASSSLPDQTPRHQAPPPVAAHLRPVGSTVPDQRPRWLQEAEAAAEAPKKRWGRK